MKHVLRFILAITLAFIAIFLLFKFPIHSLISLGALIAVVGLYDVLQKEHTILRNFPIIGHFRYLLESIGPEIRQYFVEADTDGKPLNRNQRTYIYARAKQDNSAHPFGTEHDLQKEGMEWVRHSIYPGKMPTENPRVTIGGPECTQPYSASLLNVSAMSFGSLSKNAIKALNLGAKAGGFYHNTGEGSISDYHKMGGDLTYQIGTGYFGCRDEEGNFSETKFVESATLPEVKMIELKLSQGAKPGHGGILPASKNNEEIARIRGVVPHTTVLSPPGHTAFDSPEGLLKFIQKLRTLSGGKPVGFKLCVGSRKEFEDICLAMVQLNIKPDFITVDGAEGGTGAAPITFSDHVGMPWENGLIFVADTLRKYDLKKDIKIITSSKIVNGFDVLKALCLGADLCNSARAMMLALGCIQALECHLNTCPTGVATNNERLMRGLVVEEKWVRVKNYQAEVVHDFLELLTAAGCSELSQLNRSLIYRQVDGKSVSFAELY
ncbi:MAG: FMN-binding glutamate synthase family protein [Balneolaceae bacterium]